MSIEVPAVKPTEPPRVGPTGWGRFIPYLVLFSVVAVVVAFSTLTPETVVEIPIPLPPALSESDGQELRGGFWVVEEMWLGSQVEFSEQQEIISAWQASNRWTRGERPVTFQTSTRLLRITSNQTFEITSQLRDVSNMVGTSRPRVTEMVYITRFDPVGMGTVNALPIAWNEEKGDVLKKLDAGESLKGLYAFNGNTMQVYLPGDMKAKRPTAIPKTLSSQDRLFILRRALDFESDRRPIEDYPTEELPGTVGMDAKLTTDGTVEYRSHPDYYWRVEDIPPPISRPIEKAVDPRRTGRMQAFLLPNGWIVHTEPPDPPEPPKFPESPPLPRLPDPPPPPDNRPYPVLRWIYNQAKKLN